ncbi:MAG: hypothetical protein KAI47_15455, partial [Deltaproteobacteria bacterium]|nr:hypothetical protein [Deltaproteobacteria bacterium]
RPASLPSTARPSQSSRRPRPVGDPDESVPPNLHGAATQATPLPAPPRAGAPLTTDDIDLHGQTTHLIDLPDPEPDNDDDDATHG